MNPARCDIIIPIYNKLSLTKDCLAGIYKFTHISFNLILIDNDSSGETRDYLTGFRASRSNVVLVRNSENLGWVKAVNQGFRLSESPYVCIMNNDVIVRSDGWLSSIIATIELEPDIGLANPQFEIKKKVRQDNPFIEIDFCRGYCILIKRAVLEKIGGLDENYGFGYYDDDDYSVRALRAGFRCVRVDNVFVEHIRDSTFSALFTDEKRRSLLEKNKMLFYSKWGRRLRVLFMLTKRTDSAKLSDCSFTVARKQHIVYIWSLRRFAAFQHINIRERFFPLPLHRLFFSIALYLNMTKNKSKRYDIVFVDDEGLMPLIKRFVSEAHYIDIEKDMTSTYNLIDMKSKELK